MSPHFQDYARNLNRVRLHEMIDHHVSMLRYSRAQPSLIFNPLTGKPYAPREDEMRDLVWRRRT